MNEPGKICQNDPRCFPGIVPAVTWPRPPAWAELTTPCDAILAEKPDLPVVRSDSPDTWIHGPMSDPAGAKLARNTRPLIAATEALNTQLRGWGVPVPNDAPAIAEACEQSLLYGEHTWGSAIYWIGNKLSYGEMFQKDRAAGRFDRLEGSWDEHTAYIMKAHQIITPALANTLQALAQGEGALNSPKLFSCPQSPILLKRLAIDRETRALAPRSSLTISLVHRRGSLFLPLPASLSGKGLQKVAGRA